MKRLLLLFLLIPAIVPLNAQNTIIKGEYWFDLGRQNATSFTIAPAISLNVEDNIDVSGLSDGLHSINLRFLDDSLHWSSVVSRFFYKKTLEGTPATNSLSSMEYWFDNDHSQAVLRDLSGQSDGNIDVNYDVTKLTDGLHTLHFRACDAAGNWSSAVSKYFMKRPVLSPHAENKITAYRYWLNDTMMHEVALPDPAKDIVFPDSLDLRTVPGGDHILGFQFRDLTGSWSSAVSDTIQKIRYPYAELYATPDSVCINDTVRFTALLTDADSAVWHFDARDVSGNTVEKMTFTSGGSHQVSATVIDTATMMENQYFLQPSVYVYDPSIVKLGEDTSLCEGDSLVLHGPPGMISYRWSNMTTGNTLIARYGGQYILQVTDKNGCMTSDSMNINLKNLPVFDLGVNRDLCEGDSLMLSGPIDMSSWTWSNGEATREIYVRTGGRFHLLAEGINGCFNEDSVTVYLRENPVVDLGDSLKILTSDTETLDAGSGYTAYYWNGVAGTQYYSFTGEGLGAGAHSISVTAGNEYGCTASDTILIMVESPDGRDAITLSGLHIYPVPATDHLIFDFQCGDYSRLKVSVTDIQGKRYLWNEPVEPGNSLNISMLPPGEYMIIIRLGERMSVLPVIKL